MNYINCKNNLLPSEMRKSVAFWANNSVGHINSLLNLPLGTTAVMQKEFTCELNDLLKSFKKISTMYNGEDLSGLPVKPDFLFKENRRFINLLERMKFEGFSGYPYLQQTIFHYIYEQRYINAIFGISNSGQGLITVRFSGIGNYPFICIYNQVYFWSVIGAMHPSLMMGNEKFYHLASGNTRNYLTEITNRFNHICFKLSNLKKPLKDTELEPVLSEFCKLNLDFLRFLYAIKAGSAGIFISNNSKDIPESFYKTLDHIIGEHTLVKELCESLSARLNIKSNCTERFRRN